MDETETERREDGQDVVHRFDISSGELEKPKRRTPIGGLVVDATIARTGVQLYTNADGSTRREYRPPEEVFAAKALDSVAHATLTDLHPGGLVTPDKYKEVTIGHAAGPGQKREGKYVATELHVNDADAIRKVESGERTEISCGYTCRLDRTPGVTPEGETFDAVQRDIVINHIAAGPKNWGRAGSQVRMHLDGGDAVSGLEAGSYVPAMSGNTNGAAGQQGTNGTPGAAAPPQARDDSADALAREREVSRKLSEELAKERADNAAKETAAKSAEARARADAEVEERAELIAVGRQVLGAEWSSKKEDGAPKTADAIRREVLGKVAPKAKLPDVKADGAEVEVRGLFKFALEQAAETSAANAKPRNDNGQSGKTGGIAFARASSPANPGTGGRTDAGEGGTGGGDAEEVTIEDARAARIERDKNRWRTPKTGKGA